MVISAFSVEDQVRCLVEESDAYTGLEAVTDRDDGSSVLLVASANNETPQRPRVLNLTMELRESYVRNRMWGVHIHSRRYDLSNDTVGV